MQTLRLIIYECIYKILKKKEKFLKVHLIEINFRIVKYHRGRWLSFFFWNHSSLRDLRFCLNCDLFRIALKNDGFVDIFMYSCIYF